MSDQSQSELQKAAEELSASIPVPPPDPNLQRRSELHTGLLVKVNEAAKARKALVDASQAGVDFRIASDWRGRYAEAEQALAALVEWEASIL